MPEIKNTFTQGKMNKDLDERIVPNGQYRDAVNIQISTSDEAGVGAVQNILGNTKINSIPSDSVVVGGGWECVGSIADEKNDVLYSFLAHTTQPFSAILEYTRDGNINPVVIDRGIGTLNFQDGEIITGINIIDEFLLWTDGRNEPKKINIERCKAGSTDFQTNTKLIVDNEEIFEKEIQVVVSVASANQPAATNIIEFSDTSQLTVGDQLISLQTSGGGIWNFVTSPSAGPQLRYITAINGNIVTLNEIIFTGGTANWIVGSDAVFHHYTDLSEEHITVIKKNPLKPLSVKINPADLSDKKPLFEKIFPRFSYRYKYEDGEYSTFAPFTDVVFKSLYGTDQSGVIYDNNNAYGVDEPYNSGMRNMINSIELGDFISPNMPKDVVQVDLLYKQENSNVIYVLEALENTDARWEEKFNPDSAYKGSFNVISENIYAALPENQMLRPWDNVPKIAKAQEITGNRVVYGNYKQGYDLLDTNGNKIIPKTNSGYVLRDIDTGLFVDGGLPSIKSQRNYQIGIVYGDKYGRETPVFTNEEASLAIPWGSSLSPLASESLQLKAYLGSYHPAWAEYYKFFVKETSGEYYNLAMDALYRPTKEDIEKDDHVWLSFASSDRNKLSEEDYIILKRRIGDTAQVSEENKYKILDIKNEAPDAIKYKYLKLGEVGNFAPTAGLLNDTTSGIFYNTNFRPEADKDLFYIHKTNWEASGTTKANGMFLGPTIDSQGDDLFVSWINTESATDERTKRYKVASIRVSNGNVYIVQLEEPISTEDGVLITAPGASYAELHDDVIFRVERKIIKNTEAFSGRFFVKVNNRGIIDQLQDANEIRNVFTTTNAQNIHWHADVSTPTSYNPDTGLINNENYSEQSTSGDRTKSVSGHSGADITKTESDWDALLTHMKDTSDATTTINQFFIDNMYMAASQPAEGDFAFARHSGQGWYGGNPQPKADMIYSTRKPAGIGPYFNGVSGTPTGFSTAFDYGTSPPHTDGIAWPTNSDIEPQTPTITNDGDQMVNGIPGIIITGDDHNLSSTALGFTSGIRRWKKSIHNTELTKWDYGHDPAHNGGRVMHLSFLAPGEDLHDGTGWSDLNFRNLPIKLQGIWGGGVFTKADAGAFPTFGVGTGDYTQGIHCEREYNFTQDGYSNPGTSAEEVEINYSSKPQGHSYSPRVGYSASHREKHQNQWKPWESGGVYNATIHAFVQALKTPGQRFRFKDDSTEHIYTIKRVKEKRIYNHTPWRRMYKHDNSGGVTATGDSVEEAAVIWAETRTSSNKSGNQTERDIFTDKVEEFGKANNRRVCYIVHIEDNPFPNASATNQGNPLQTDSSSTFNAVDATTIEFVDEDFSIFDGKISENPAIWETEPKDNIDLDIYYEAGQAYPITITEKTRELFAPIGCKVTLVNGSSTDGTDIDCELIEWQSSNNGRNFVLDPGLPFADAGGVEIDYTGLQIRFTREDGSYTTSRLTAETAGNETAVTTRTIFTIDPSTDPTSEIGLSWYNCFSFGNGVESNKIRDDFNAMTITNGVRANSTINRPYVEEHRKSGLIYSGIYNSKNGINNLNQFIMAEKITKDLNPTYGSIQKLFSRVIRQSSSLIAFCEDKVVSIISNKNALYNADGNPQIVASNAILGDANAFVGDYGISQNPESFAKESYRAYFTDRQRGVVLRLSMDGLTPISETGMSDWFKDEFKDDTHFNIIGSYDNYKKDYNLTFDRGGKTYGNQEEAAQARENALTPPSQTVTFSEDVKGWVSFKSFIQESGVSMSGNYYTFYNGICYKHHVEKDEDGNSVDRNSFYGTTNLGSSIKFLLNESPLVIKNYNTLNYDGDENWTCDSVITDQQSGTVNSFIEKEGKWFNYISGNENVDTRAFNFQGIGIANGINYN